MEQSTDILADIVVIGGGHAGCEAALAGSRMGRSVVLITMRKDRIAEMSCNPSIGGVGKGQLVREIDALGGEMGRNADFTGIHFKRLNTRKGSAVQSSRCQSDKAIYAKRMGATINLESRIRVLESEVKEILVEGGRVRGVRCELPGEKAVLDIGSRAVVVTAGTFMGAVMHCGLNESEGGRFGEQSSNGLSRQLESLGLRLMRLKTGTPPRINRKSIDFYKMEEQPGDKEPALFSFSGGRIELPQVSCFLGYTNSTTHEVIRRNLGRSPLFSGKISGIGPRYCPSIEDKVVKFPEKGRHHVFFEPESLNSDWIYPNGISTSLPADVQDEFIRTIAGCERAEIVRPGYAVEYDCIDPIQLNHALECRTISGLFFGGQVNGTSGYEEAAAQGLLAGINAARSVVGATPVEISRSNAYIGVMVDDLVTLGISEPYRMFTSRAEYRLSIREDNADSRLTPLGIEIGLVSADRREAYEIKQREMERARTFLSATIVKPKPSLPKPFSEATLARNLLKRPEYGFEDVVFAAGSEIAFGKNIAETIEIETKYEGYIAMQTEEIARLKRLGTHRLPEHLDYSAVSGLSREVTEKLTRRAPKTLAEAATISGITPAAMTAILSYVNRDHV